ncbi:MAG TPA: hypothetical protein VFQ88_10520 [Nevskiaceae bacterium]|nr:hypothetical protein [Nevskiaceae bacterium]
MNAATTTESFCSVLWPAALADAVTLVEAEPDSFHDLNLDQLLRSIDSHWQEEKLAPFFYTPVSDLKTIAYRQAVFRDVGQPAIHGALQRFVTTMREARTHLLDAAKLDHEPESDRACLAAATAYIGAVEALTRDLATLPITAGAFAALHAYLSAYLADPGFTALRSDVRACIGALTAIRYGLVFHGDSLTVRPWKDEAEACPAIEALFDRFRERDAKDYRIKPSLRSGVGLNHIAAQVLDKVALLNPTAFAALHAFPSNHPDFIDARIARLARELGFYLGWTQFVAPLQAAKLPLCQPSLETTGQSVAASDAFDVVLAAHQCKNQVRVVGNSFELGAGESMIVVSGPNHGGKTTFARMFGQLHWLAALGCSPIPGTAAHLRLFDHLYTHFGREEDSASGRGKLQDELVRMHAILEHATARSVLVINEIFSSTTLADALSLGKQVMTQVTDCGALGVCVTFLTELADFDPHTVSMVAGVDPQDPAVRTFKVERRTADGLAYALAVAEKHRVTHDWLLRRIAP